MTLTEIKKNITSIFMVPTLGIPREKLRTNGFVNAYIRDDKRDVQYEDCIYILFRPDQIDGFKDFLNDEYERTKAIIDDYDYEKGFVILVYQLDKKFKRDFDLVKQGKYSKTSHSFQEKFPKVIKIRKNGLHKDEISLQYRVFNKTEDMKQYWEEKLGVEFTDDMEVWSGWDEKNEVLNIDKIKQYV